MDILKAASVTIMAGGIFYLGYRFARSRQRDTAATAWKHNFDILNEDLQLLKESFKEAASDSQKKVKSRFDAIMNKAQQQIHRTDLLELLRAEVGEVQEMLNDLKAVVTKDGK